MQWRKGVDAVTTKANSVCQLCARTVDLSSLRVEGAAANVSLFLTAVTVARDPTGSFIGLHVGSSAGSSKVHRFTLVHVVACFICV